jgi:hypothetical protein
MVRRAALVVQQRAHVTLDTTGAMKLSICAEAQEPSFPQKRESIDL